MLNITIPSIELYNERTQEFIITKEHTLKLEHSLVSLSKWESKWQKPFLTTKDKTREETLDYIRCMTITQNVDPAIYHQIPNNILDQIAEYIDSPMTATTFSSPDQKKTNKEVITAEIIYYWMIAYQIPHECQTWHLGRLLTLINVCSIKNQPKGKGNNKAAMARQRELNAARKKTLNTTG